MIVSVCASIYLVNQNNALSSQANADLARVDMMATLSQAQVNIDTELTRISESLVYASEQLSTTGITGTQATAILDALTANSSFIINSATENLDNTIVAAAPANWSYIIGRNVGEQTYLNPNAYGEITPMMTPVVAVQSDMMANIVAAPIFNDNRELIGYLSVIFDPSTLIRAAASSALAGKPYELIGMQIDGLMIYDSDPNQQWHNMFTDEAYANYTSLLALGHRVVAATSGYGTYSYYHVGTMDPATKESYWTTVTAFGQEWRLIIVNALSP